MRFCASIMGKICLRWVARKRMKRWAILLLPALLRALVPVGFMPMLGPGFNVQMVICDGYAPVPWTSATSKPMDMPMGMPMDARGSSDSGGGVPARHEDQSNCPYGCAPALGALPTLAGLPALLIRRSSRPPVAIAQIAYFEVSHRAQSPRGPPA
jgi:hypothetical protein